MIISEQKDHVDIGARGDVGPTRRRILLAKAYAGSKGETHARRLIIGWRRLERRIWPAHGALSIEQHAIIISRTGLQCTNPHIGHKTRRLIEFRAFED